MILFQHSKVYQGVKFLFFIFQEEIPDFFDEYLISFCPLIQGAPTIMVWKWIFLLTEYNFD
jgi:hypothetical protein